MLFNSPEFIVFALVFFPVFHALRTQRARLRFLTFASFFFYAQWDWRFLPLLAGTGLVDFVAALYIVKWRRHAKALLFVSLSANIGALAFFKYFGFFAQNASVVSQALGLGTVDFPLKVLLPVGISFYTFQSMSYTIDVYRGELQPTRSLLHFFASLTVFPHLVAGPIVRASFMLPQLTERHEVTEEARWDGWLLVSRGYFKKCVIADNLAIYVNDAFKWPAGDHSGAYWWLTVAMFAVQIYGDFSGYSDIAIGLAKWMGLQLPLNFDHPYLSASFREFWQRWHISLSSWFRDYVYLPLGGNRVPAPRAVVNLWVTMLLSGLWHGASWTFVLWGATHALFLTLERLTAWPARLERALGAPGRALSILIVLFLTLVSWVFFRAPDVGYAVSVLQQMFALGHLGSMTAALDGRRFGALLLLAVLARHLYVALDLRAAFERHVPMGAVRIAAAAVAVVLAVYLRGPGQQFIYFQF